MTRVLIWASKTPFQNVHNGPLPREALNCFWHSLSQLEEKNAGNIVFAQSVYKALSAPDTELSVDGYALAHRRSYRSEAERINAEYDAFVIPLANTFRLSYRETLARLTENLRHVRIPCVVTGIGAQLSFGGGFEELKGIEREAKAFVGAILDRSEAIGVRGETTRDYLLHLGFPEDQVQVIGCPSMFYNGEHMAVERKPLERVAFNLTPSKDPRLRPFTDWFNAHPENVTHVVQDAKWMREVGTGRAPDPATPPTAEEPVPQLLQWGRVAFIRDLIPWIDLLRTHSFSIGNKIHGNIVGLLGGTPAHVIAHDSRTLELARYFEIPHTPVTALEGFDLRRTWEESDYGPLTANHGRRLATYAGFLERNGLSHILYDAEALARHEARVRRSLAEARLPRARGYARMALRFASTPVRTLYRRRRSA